MSQKRILFLLTTHLLEYSQERGQKLSNKLEDLEFEYQYDMVSVFDEFSFTNASSFAEYIGMNPSLMRRYKVNAPLSRLSS